MQSWCQKMQSEVKQPKLSADISIARRNACEVESQILFYQNMPSKVHQNFSTQVSYLDAFVIAIRAPANNGAQEVQYTIKLHAVAIV